MIIRKINKSDSNMIEKLHKQLYSEEGKKYVDLSDNNFVSYPISLVIEENGKLIGYINGEVLGWADRLEGYINDLFIEEEYRGKGHGKDLVKRFEEEALKLSDNVYIFVSIDPDEDEPDPSVFYQKINYKVMKYPWLVKKLENDV
jgi:GNAT superfamily N-acetyltransferase